jgi:hypothetical protein
VIRSFIIDAWAPVDLAELARRTLAALSKVLVNPTPATLETVELHRFEPWICVVYRPDKQRTPFGFAVGPALAETVDPVRAVGLVVELSAVQTSYFTKGQRASIENDANGMQRARNNASSWTGPKPII